MAVPQPSCRPPASLCHLGSRRPRHRKPAPSRPPHPSAAAGRGVVPRAPEFPESLQPVRYLALRGVQVEPKTQRPCLRISNMCYPVRKCSDQVMFDDSSTIDSYWQVILISLILLVM